MRMQQLGIVLKLKKNIFKSIFITIHTVKCRHLFFSIFPFPVPDSRTRLPAGHLLMRRSGGEHLPGTFFSLDGARDQALTSALTVSVACWGDGGWKVLACRQMHLKSNPENWHGTEEWSFFGDFFTFQTGENLRSMLMFKGVRGKNTLASMNWTQHRQLQTILCAVKICKLQDIDRYSFLLLSRKKSKHQKQPFNPFPPATSKNIFFHLMWLLFGLAKRMGTTKDSLHQFGTTR